MQAAFGGGAADVSDRLFFPVGGGILRASQGARHLAVDVDLQRPLIRTHPEKGNSLLYAIPVQILKLHLLGQLPAEGRGVLAPLREHLVDLIVQLQIIVGRLGRRDM